MAFSTTSEPPLLDPTEANSRLADELARQARSIIDTWGAGTPQKALLVHFSRSAHAAHTKPSKGAVEMPNEIRARIELPSPRPALAIYDEHGAATPISRATSLEAILNAALKVEYTDVNTILHSGKDHPKARTDLPKVAYNNREFVIQFPVGKSPEECKRKLAEMAEGLKSHIDMCVMQRFNDVSGKDGLQEMVRADFTPG